MRHAKLHGEAKAVLTILRLALVRTVNNKHTLAIRAGLRNGLSRLCVCSAFVHPASEFSRKFFLRMRIFPVQQLITDD